MLAEVLEKPATVENSLREVSKIRSRVTDAVEEGVRSASQAIRHGLCKSHANRNNLF